MLDHDLLARYLDNALDPVERDRVETALSNDPAALREVLDQQAVDVALRVILSGAEAEARVRESVMAVVRSGSLQKLKTKVMTTTREQQPWWQRFRLFPARQDWAWAGLSAAVAAGVVIGLWLWLAGPQAVETVAQLEQVSDHVRVVRGGHEQEAGNGFDLQRGDAVRVAAGSTAAIRFADATRLALSDDALLALRAVPAAGKQVDFTMGTLQASVTKQPAGHPMIIHTPEASATIVGTTFTIRLKPRLTRLEVSEGLVRLARLEENRAVDVAAGQAAEAGPGKELRVEPLQKSATAGKDGELSSRDAALWPFAATSPWNQPIGSGAAYADQSSPILKLETGAWIASDQNSSAVFVAKATDPQIRVLAGKETALFATVHLPASVAVGTPAWYNFTLVDETHRFAYEFTNAQRLDNGDIQARQCVKFDLHGPGLAPPRPGTPSASGLTMLGGLIRKGELTSGIRHALAVAVPRNALNRNGPNGQPSIWPAEGWQKPDDWLKTLSTTGNIHLGTLLAIPGSVDLNKLGIGQSGPLYEIARALQDYGAYITEAFEDTALRSVGPKEKPHLRIATEPDAASGLSLPWAELPTQLSQITRQLKVVSNNAPDHLGGGGVPRRPLAPVLPER